MGDRPHNPADVEQAISDCAERIHGLVTTTTSYERRMRRLNREYDKALAHAYLAASGPAHEKKHRAILATVEEREEAEEAEITYNYAYRQARAAENELRAWQSVGASVRSMYSVETGFGK